MRIRTTMVVAFVGVLALPVAALAQGSSGPPPIAIDDCRVLTNTYYVFPTRLDVPYIVTRGLAISFHNRAGQSASEVHFEANYRGEDVTITDVGSFAPNVNINHKYDQFVNFAYLGTHPNRCRVLYVKLADGTTWNFSVARPQAAEH